MSAPAPLGVNLAGYLDATLGVGEAARNVSAALAAAGVSVAEHGLASAHGPGRGGELRHDTTVVCANPEGMQGAADQLGAGLRPPTRRIGFWWWEVPGLPQRARRAFDLVDEVWVGSRYVADLLGAIAPVPVVRVPLPVPEPQARPFGRGRLGAPGAHLFGFAYDYSSVAARKNPLGLIEAFQRAFPQPEPVGLVLKTMGGDTHPQEHGPVQAAAAADPRIRIVDGRLDAAEKNGLIQALDTYVSLHRAEGFGLTLAEAMLLGTPVIATDYGGSRDLATSFNALLVDHEPTRVGPGHDPYPADAEWAEPDLDHAAAQLRVAFEHPEAGRRRAERARADVQAAHAPPAAGRAMAARLAEAQHVPSHSGGIVEPLDLDGVRERIARGPRPAPGLAGPRAAARDAALRAMAPATVHQRLVDEELLAVLRTLDERVRALMAGQRVLARELRAGPDEDAGGGPDVAASPP